MSLGPFTEKHGFLQCNAAPVSLVGRDLISKSERLICLATNRDLTLESPDYPESDLLIAFIERFMNQAASHLANKKVL